MTPAYFCWDAQNGGVSQADVDFRRSGIAGLLLRSLARILRASCYMPLRMLTAIRPPKYGSAQSSMIVWRTNGYVRRAVTLMAPRLIPQKRFHEYVDFRSGRIVGT